MSLTRTTCLHMDFQLAYMNKIVCTRDFPAFLIDGEKIQNGQKQESILNTILLLKTQCVNRTIRI